MLKMKNQIKKCSVLVVIICVKCYLFLYVHVDNLNKSYVSCMYTICSINKYPGDYHVHNTI